MPNQPEFTIDNVLADHFSEVTDPRKERRKEHLLLDIIGLTICAVVCGADGFVGIERFGKAKRDWLGGFLDLPNGIPSHDTIGRVFALLDPEEFEAGFRAWIQTVFEKTDGEVVAVDGKTLRGSYDSASDKKSAIHMVSAWAAENRLTLGGVKTDAKSNEITAIPELLRLLDVSGCIVTVDAMGCQKAIAEQITNEGADYVLQLKANQGELYADTKMLFDRLDPEEYKHIDGGHGRVEVRRCQAVDVAGRGLVDTEGWTGLQSIAKVEAQRHKDGQTSTETRYYITSLEADAERLLRAARTHWHIENKLHWVLDVAFREDDCRIRRGHADQNMAAVRRMAVSLLKSETTSSVGVKNKRLQAGWNPDYLLKVLRAGN